MVSYNILADAYIKPGRYDHVPQEALDPTARRALLLKRLLAFSADVYALQEVEPTAFEAIASTLGEEYWSDLVLKKDRPEGCALFVRRALEPNALAPVITHFENKPQVAGVVQLRFGALSVHIANTHLRWHRPETPVDAHQGRAHLVAILERAAKSPESPWLLAGDFNANSESQVIAAAMNEGFRLSCRSQRPWDTTNIHRRRRKLDYVLYQPKWLRPYPGILPKLDRDTPMPSSSEPSDHLPVFVEFASL